MDAERQRAIAPPVEENVVYNTRVGHSSRTSGQGLTCQAIEQLRSLIALLAGAVAGILGLTSYHGFAFYALTTLVSSVAIFVLRVGGKPSHYFTSPWQFWLNSVADGVTSYVLLWTLCYGLVYVYD